MLVRQDDDEHNSDTVSISSGTQEIGMESVKQVTLITSLACHGNGEIFFGGKEDGSLYLYQTNSGRQMYKLVSHAKGVSIVSLFFDSESHTLVSTDITSRVVAHKLELRHHGWQTTEVLLDHYTGAAVKQVLTNPGSSRLLISTSDSGTLFSLSPDGHAAIVATLQWEDRSSYKWGTHPSDHHQLIFILNNFVHLYNWQTLERITSEGGILLEGSILPELTIQSITSCFNNSVIATAFSESSRMQSGFRLLLWDASNFTPDSKSAAPIPRYHALADQVRSLIGSDGKRLAFLHSNDWVSSAEARVAETDRYNRHFFIPADWLTTNVTMMTEETPNGDIIFVKRDEVAVIKRGYENIERETSNAPQQPGKRPSLVGRRKSPLRRSPSPRGI